MQRELLVEVQLHILAHRHPETTRVATQHRIEQSLFGSHLAVGIKPEADAVDQIALAVLDTCEFVRITCHQLLDLVRHRSRLPIAIERTMMQDGGIALYQFLVADSQCTTRQHLQIERREACLYGIFETQSDSLIHHTVVVINQW